MKKAIVYGYGVSGKGAEKLLIQKGYEVTVVDDSIGMKKEEVIDKLNEYVMMIKSPGISPENELVKKAFAAGLEIIDEIELASRYYKGKIIAVTGTNGKTTTTTKIKEILEFGGFNAIFAGNIGNSFAEVAATGVTYDYLVLEVSSYQLELIKEFKPFIAMSINHTPDHMTRYATLEDYYSAKFNIFINQDKNDYAIINLDDQFSVDYYDKKKIDSKKLFVSQKKPEEFYTIEGIMHKPFNKSGEDKETTEPLTAFYSDEKIYYNNKELLETPKLKLKGVHNIENIFFIVTAAKIAGVSDEKIREFLYTTEGLEHRVEEFFTKGKTVFVNDSKGTNIDATIKALDGYKEKVILICGGKDKNLDNRSLCEKIAEKSKMLFLMGETADLLEKLSIEAGMDKDKIYNEKTIENVIKKIKEVVNTEEGNTVLFSPAASSFDQFKSFEERGKIFKDLVLKYFGG